MIPLQILSVKCSNAIVNKELIFETIRFARKVH